jgi:exopolysaccharide biosynthesis polyprenyl glycosylphosphotransferase
MKQIGGQSLPTMSSLSATSVSESSEPIMSRSSTGVPLESGQTSTIAFEGRPSWVPASSRTTLVRRVLLITDSVALATAFLLAEVLFRGENASASKSDSLVFVATLPLLLGLASLNGLYDVDRDQPDRSTVDDFAGLFQVVTIAAWSLFAIAGTLRFDKPNVHSAFAFWVLGLAFITIGRAVARAYCKRQASYIQNALIFGAGDVGQDVARKIRHHPEYGINPVGFVDTSPKTLRAEVEDLPVYDSDTSEIPRLLEALGVERVIIAFSKDMPAATLELVQVLRRLGLRVDIVPRLFQTFSPNATMQTLEGLPLIQLPPTRFQQAARFAKRTMDLIVAISALMILMPLFALIAWKIKRDSPGPILFRQVRLGVSMRPFVVNKFRTMRVGASDQTHREYIEQTMNSTVQPEKSGIYKLERKSDITRVGRWLRKTSLDELPQLLNVIKGEMSLVGPRPCLPYEVEHFAPQHFERFVVQPGLTGLWQVTARAHTTFAEALEMDVAYVRGWSVLLDIRLLLQTPRALFVQRTATA